jgi:hypothetical protein
VDRRWDPGDAERATCWGEVAGGRPGAGARGAASPTLNQLNRRRLSCRGQVLVADDHAVVGDAKILLRARHPGGGRPGRWQARMTAGRGRGRWTSCAGRQRLTSTELKHEAAARFALSVCPKPYALRTALEQRNLTKSVPRGVGPGRAPGGRRRQICRPGSRPNGWPGAGRDRCRPCDQLSIAVQVLCPDRPSKSAGEIQEPP